MRSLPSKHTKNICAHRPFRHATDLVQKVVKRLDHDPGAICLDVLTFPPVHVMLARGVSLLEKVVAYPAGTGQERNALLNKLCSALALWEVRSGFEKCGETFASVIPVYLHALA